MNKITQEYLTELFRKYNAAYFDGQLRQVDTYLHRPAEWINILDVHQADVLR